MEAVAPLTGALGSARLLPDDLTPDQVDDRGGGARSRWVQAVEEDPGREVRVSADVPAPPVSGSRCPSPRSVFHGATTPQCVIVCHRTPPRLWKTGLRPGLWTTHAEGPGTR